MAIDVQDKENQAWVEKIEHQKLSLYLKRFRGKLFNYSYIYMIQVHNERPTNS